MDHSTSAAHVHGESFDTQVGRGSSPDSHQEELLTEQGRIELIQKHLRLGESTQAESLLRRWLVETPESLQANEMMAAVFAARKEFDSAIEILDRVASGHSDQAPRLRMMASTLEYESGNATAAIERLEEMLESHPEFHFGRRQLAQFLVLQGFSFDANEHIRRLVQHTTLNLDELTCLMLPARSWLTDSKIAEATKNGRLANLGVMAVANHYRMKGLLSDSLHTITESSQFQDRVPCVVALYCRVLAEAQQYDQLAEWIGKSPSSCQLYPDFWMAMGALATDRQREAAATCFAQVIRLEPSLVDAHLGMAQSLDLQKRPDLAQLFRLRTSELTGLEKSVKKIRRSTTPDRLTPFEIAKTLNEIGRPLEALAWQELVVEHFAPESKKLQSIRNYKQRTLTSLSSGYDMRKVLQGADDLADYDVVNWVKALRENAQSSVRITNSKHDGIPPTGRPDKQQTTLTKSYPPVFRNVAEESGIKFRYRNGIVPIERYFRIFESLGGGVSCLDYDLDGNIDLFFAQAACDPPLGAASEPNALCRNLHHHFVDVSVTSIEDARCYTIGVSMGDWNQDGFPDLMIGNLGVSELLLNQGDGTFKSHPTTHFSENPTFTSSVAIVDVSGDGLPDVIQINYLDDPSIFHRIEFDAEGEPLDLPDPLKYLPGIDRLYVSNGDGTMTARRLGDATAEISSTGLGILVTDFDESPGNEIFVANDQRPNHFWRLQTASDGSKQWNESAVASGVALGKFGGSMACMGVAAVDFDHNGTLDLHVTNFLEQWSNLYLQNSSGTFQDASVPFNLAEHSQPMVGFGTQALDHDNDGQWDLAIGNGHIDDFKGLEFAMPTQFFVGTESGFQLAKVTGDDDYWLSPHYSRAMAKTDWNRDGKVDLVITDFKEKTVLMQNFTATPNHWLRVELVGTKSERDAIGARVTITDGEFQRVQMVQTGGYLSNNERSSFFGLGQTEEIDELLVEWPSGLSQSFKDVKADQSYLVVESEAEIWRFSPPTQ